MSDKTDTTGAGRMTKAEARRIIRAKVTDYLRLRHTELPEEVDPDSALGELWSDEVERCADRIDRLNP